MVLVLERSLCEILSQIKLGMDISGTKRLSVKELKTVKCGARVM